MGTNGKLEVVGEGVFLSVGGGGGGGIPLSWRWWGRGYSSQISFQMINYCRGRGDEA